MAICFQSKCCIRLTIIDALLMSGGTGRRKVGKLLSSDNRGDVEVVAICMNT